MSGLPEFESPESRMTEALQSFTAPLTLLGESAMGYRKQLEAAGWSPTVAEQAAGHMLIEMQKAVFTELAGLAAAKRGGK